MTQVLATTLLPLMMMVAGIGDFLSYRIPNWLTGLIALLFFPLALATGMPAGMMAWHIVVGAVLLAIGFGLFAMGWIGGGDAKLMAAAGLWFGWPSAVSFLIATALAGGVLAIAMALWAALHSHNEMRGNARLSRWMSAKPDIPYGVAFAAGAILVFPGSWWMRLAG